MDKFEMKKQKENEEYIMKNHNRFLEHEHRYGIIKNIHDDRTGDYFRKLKQIEKNKKMKQKEKDKAKEERKQMIEERNAMI